MLLCGFANSFPARQAQRLLDSYRQLRRIEGILRRWSQEGETELPAEAAPYYRVAVRCGFASPEDFQAAVAQWRQDLRQVYDLVLASA